MAEREDARRLLERLDLTEYEVTALEELLSLGRTTAPSLSEATGVPKARIYGVLEELAERGFLKEIPGRPKEYQAKSPETILERAEENVRQEFESRTQELDEMREAFVSTFGPRFERASEDISPTEELFYVVAVGEPSEGETRALYRDAEDAVYVLTKSFAYLDRVEPAVRETLDAGVAVNAILHRPSLIEPEKRDRQAEIVSTLRDDLPGVDVRYSESRLPWRGTFVDPSMDYDTGKAILLVEEEDVPNHMRQAAITEHGAFVAGLKRYFDLVWAFDSTTDYPG